MGGIFGGTPDTSGQEKIAREQQEAAERESEKLKKQEAAKRRSALGTSGARSLLTGSETGLKKTLG